MQPRETCSDYKPGKFLLPVSEDDKVLLTVAPWEWVASTEKSFSIILTLTGVFTGESEDEISWLFKLFETLTMKTIRVNYTNLKACSKRKCLRKQSQCMLSMVVWPPKDLWSTGTYF